ncbi:hypothetical protein EJB05_53689, partial [Eragrostis curvula]
MSGQRAPSLSPMPPQPQPFRFWLPFRSNVGSWQQQPRPPSSRPTPSSPQPQPPPPPPPTPAARSRAHAVEEDIPIQGESSDESDRVSVQSSDSSQLRGGGGRPSMADLELTLSGAPPTRQEQSSGGGGNDTKIAISGFPRSRLFDGARAPYRQEIEDGLKSLGAGRGTPPPRPESGSGQGQGYRVITLAGHNVGASMVVGGGGPREAHATPPNAAETEDDGSAARPPAVAANVNSNVQNVNNSSMEGSTCSAGNPGVHVDIKGARDEPAAATPAPREDEKTKEPKRRPPLVVPATAPAKTRPRRCLRSLMMENGSDTEAARKPKPGACKFQCVSDHKPPPPASNGGGAGGRNAEDGGKSSTKEAN